jgi:hypothetical protein
MPHENGFALGGIGISNLAKQFVSILVQILLRNIVLDPCCYVIAG